MRTTAVYLTFILTWFTLWLFTGDRFWWVAMLNRVVPYLFIPTLVIIIVTLIRRKPRLVLLAGLPLLIFVWLFRPYLLPQWGDEDGTAVLRIMTYNVLFSNQDYEGVAEVIRTYQPDLVALQEVQPRMMAELRKRLAAEYPYSLMGTRNQYGTTAVFSRYPFVDQEVLDLGDDRPATMVTIEKEGELVTFTAVHLRAYGLRWVPVLQMPQAIGERTRLQNRQAEILLNALAEREGTVIIGCDCNSKETSSSYRLLQEELVNAAHSNGLFSPALPGTHPDTNLNHIDYIFYQGNLATSSSYIIQNSGGSDHHPVLAIFTTR
jgi:endonuclease/exonuclease/phosphatase (EEP) superfamily protein YafD